MNCRAVRVREVCPKPRAIVLAIVLMMLAGAAFAQEQHANVARGFQADRVYDVFGLDTVNVFNGNVTIRIPIGLQYPAGGNLQYGLALTYNSKVWDYEEEPLHDLNDNSLPMPVPGYAFNAGIGWQVSLGRLIAPDDVQYRCALLDQPPRGHLCVDPAKNLWAYESADGAVHPFSESYSGANNEPWAYSRDGSNLRLTDLVTSIEGNEMLRRRTVQFPDGGSQTFQSVKVANNGDEWDWDRYRLIAIRDAYGNQVDVKMTAEAWTIRDRFGRETTITFGAATGRLERNRLVTSIALPAPGVPASTPTADARMLYRFVYDLGHGDGVYQDALGNWYPGRSILRNCGDSWANADEDYRVVSVPFLRFVEIPGTDPNGVATRYEFRYHYDPNETFNEPRCRQATINTMVLPTGGEVQWEWGSAFETASSFCDLIPITQTAAISARVLKEGNNVVSRTLYKRDSIVVPNCKVQCGKPPGTLADPPNEMTTTVLSADGNKTVHYFAIPAGRNPPNGCTIAPVEHYGLPFSASQPLLDKDNHPYLLPKAQGGVPSPLYLSTTAWSQCGPPSGNDPFAVTCSARRDTYVRYETFGETVKPFAPAGPYDTHQTATVTLFDDADANEPTFGRHYVQSTQTDYDGFGHFRQSVQKSSFGATQTTRVEYNPGCINGYRTGYDGLPHLCFGASWITGTYDGRTVTSNDKTEASKTVFNAAGSPIRQWTFRATDGTASTNAANPDFVQLYDYSSAGDLVLTRWARGLYTSTFNESSLTVDSRVANAYDPASGALQRSWFVDPSPSAVWPSGQLDIVSATIDPATALPLTTKDPSGIETQYAYDPLGRLTSIRVAPSPSGYAGGSSEYEYFAYVSAQSPARVVARQRDRQNAVTGGTTYTYDGFGRVIREAVLQPNGKTSVRDVTYDAMGRKASASQPGFDAPHSARTTYAYDGYGRTTAVTAPDQSTTLFDYTGVRKTRRTISIGQTAAITDGALTGVTQAASTTCESYDSFGRLVQVVEPSGTTVTAGDPCTPGSGRVATRYAYDVGGRLERVELGDQTPRTFTYDAAGMLLAESHPEVPSVMYGGHDAKGNVGTKAIGNKYALQYAYDAAGRLRLVRDTKADRLLQELVFDRWESASPFGSADPSLQPGRLLKAVRYNYLGFAPEVSQYVVTDLFAYDQAGRRDRKKTTVTDPAGSVETFETSSTLDEAGRPLSISYPKCVNCGVNRELAVGYSYDKGAIVNVAGFTADSAIQYHANGLVAQLVHRSSGGAALVTEETTIDDSTGMARPQSIRFTAVQSCSAITTQPADTWVGVDHRATFHVAVSGTGATFQWYVATSAHPEGLAVDGATSADFTTPVLSTSTSYWCQVDDGTCSSRTVTVTARVCEPLRLLSPAPAAGGVTNVTRYIVANTALQLAVEAAAASLTYKWWKDATPDDGVNNYTAVPSASGPVLNLPGGIAANTRYVVVIQNGCNADDRQNVIFDVKLSICDNRFWINLPESWAISTPGELVDLSVEMESPSGSYSFDWYVDGELRATTTSVNGVGVFSVPVSTFATAWVKVTHTCDGGAVSTVESRRTFIYLWSRCDVPPVRTDQTLITLPHDTPIIVAACDRPDVTYQWYQGESGDTNRPLASTAGKPKELQTGTMPGLYWVRATAPCGGFADSQTVIVTTDTCPVVRFDRQPADVETAAGADVRLTAMAVNPRTLQYAWYEATPDPNDADPLVGVGPVLTRQPLRSATYYAIANNDCTQTTSRRATVHVTACSSISISAQPQDQWILEGYPAAVSITASGVETLRYQWYEGASGDTSHPVAHPSAQTASLQIAPAATTRYWVRLSFDRAGMCAVDSRTVTVSVCRPPTLRSTPAILSSRYPGTRQYLVVQADGEGLHYQWFEGAVGDETHPTGADVPSLTVAPMATALYWVKVSTLCPPSFNAQPLRVGFTVEVCPQITTQPQDQVVVSGNTATLSVAAAGGPFTYQWYRGPAGNVSSGVLGTSATFVTPAITANTSFWVRVTGPSCSTNSRTVAVTLCSEPHVSWSVYKTSVTTNELQQLEVTVTPASGVSLSFYTGTPGNIAASTLIAGPRLSPAVQVTTGVTTTYWVRATLGSCYADTAGLTVNVCVPTITAQPQAAILDKTTNPAATATLGVTANGGALTYRWYEGTAPDVSHPVAGGTAATLQVSPSATTSYWVRVTGSCQASADSASAQVTLCQTPAITFHPGAREILANAQTTLQVTATGTNLHYQWYEGAAGVTTKPVGLDQVTLTVNPAVTTDYWVRVSGACGSADSTTAKVSIQPIVTQQPVHTYVTKNTSAILKVVATGTQLRYQWYRADDSIVTGATSNEYTTPPVTAQACYRVRVYSGDAVWLSNGACAVPCTVATPTATASAGAGSDVTLSVATTAGVTYQWYRGNSGDTSQPVGVDSVLIVRPTATTYYWVRATNGTICTADSTAVRVDVCLPRIVTQPAGSTIQPNTPTSLTVVAEGTPALAYQWYAGDSGVTSAPIANATQATYSFTPSVTGKYWVRVTSAAGAGCYIDSATAQVQVCAPPAFTTQPASAVVARNVAYTLSAGVSGTGPLTYEWYRGTSPDRTNLVGTSETLTVTLDATTRYWVRVANSCGVQNSATATLSVAPSITVEPTDRTICRGGSTTFNVTTPATDAAYQWYQGTVAQPTATLGTTASQLLTNVQQTLTAWCRVSSGAASTNTRVATVTVQQTTPQISQQWDANAQCVRLTAVVPTADVGKVAFEWYRGAVGDTSNLVSWTGSTCVAANSGNSYWLRATFTAAPNCTSNSTAVQP